MRVSRWETRNSFPLDSRLQFPSPMVLWSLTFLGIAYIANSLGFAGIAWTANGLAGTVVWFTCMRWWLARREVRKPEPSPIPVERARFLGS